MAENRDIKYTGRNFDNLRGQLIEFAKNYFPDSYNDFSPTSPGMMFIEMASYVGDVLSFYQDSQIQESFIQYAKNPGNLYNLAYMFGYRPKVVTPAEVTLDVTQEVDAVATSPYEPDFTQALVISENSIVSSTSAGQVPFLLYDKVDFGFSSSLDPTKVDILTTSGGNPATYKLTKQVKARSGEVKTITRTFNAAEKYATVTIDDTNIVGVVSITDNGGGDSTWYEVPFLGQETVFVEERNTNSDLGTVYNSLTLKKTPKRFVTRFNSAGQLTIQFGAGTQQGSDDTFVPSIENVGLGTNTGVSRLDYAYDPSNFLYTRSYGLAPSNTTLTIQYLVSPGVSANAPANSITTNTGITNTGDSTQIATLAFNNPQAASGGSDGDTVEELRQNALRAFNEQGRAVTTSDYTVRALSLPKTLGNIAKVYVQQDQLIGKSTTDSIIDSNPLALSMYVLAYDSNGYLIPASSTLKDNLKKYLSQYMMITDSINIRDAFVINIGIDYEIVTYPNATSREVLLACNSAITNYLAVENRNINSTINLSELSLILDKVKGVQTVKGIKVTNKAGGNYSAYSYDIAGATRNGIVYPSMDISIFEIKFPNTDIKGRITTP